MLSDFERISRSASVFTQEPEGSTNDEHPFVARNIHTKLPEKIKKLFDDAHYPQATFEAAKFLDKKIAKFSSLNKSGAALMQEAFKEQSPAIKLNDLATTSEIDEQKGYQWIFTGSVWAIRNPRGHEFDVDDSIDQCLDHLSFFSMLIRRLEQSGFKFD